MSHPHSAPAAQMSAADIRSIIIGLMTAMFPGALDSTIIAPAMPTIGRELGNVENLPWIVTSYLLMSTASTPLYGKLSDIHGRRIVLLTAIFIFAIGSLLCALAPTMITLALARGLQGIGGGGLVSLSLTIIGDVVPVRQRPKYQVYTSIMWTVSSLAGPILGGYFAELWHWSLIFWINMPLCLLAYVLIDSKLKRLPRHERPHKLDFLGAFLLVAASILFQLALSWGGTHYAWNSSVILAVLSGGALASALLVWRQLTAEEPLLPVAILSNQIVLTASTSVGLAMAVFIGLTIYLPLYFEIGLGFSASESGLALLPLMVCTTIGAMGAGRTMMRVKHYSLIPMVGLGAGALCLLPMFFVPVGLPLVWIEILFALASIGVGTVFPISMVSVQNSVVVHQLGTATATVSFMRNFGSAIGVAIFGTVVISGGISRDHAADAIVTSAQFNEVFRWVFLIGAIGLGLSFLTMAMMEVRPLLDRRAQAPSEEEAGPQA